MTGSLVRGNQPDNCASASCTNSARTRITVPCSTASLGAAIGSAPDNAILMLRPGCVYRLSSALPSVTRDLTIDGNGDTITRQRGSFTILTDVGVNLALNRVSITNTAGGSGALYAVKGAQVAVTDCRFHDDNGTAGAILVERGSNLTTDRDKFTGNKGATGGAILVANGSAAAVSRSIFTGNTGRGGGAIFSHDSSMTVTDSSFSGNKSEGAGGAIAATGFLAVSGTVFHANAGSDGGAIYDNGPATTFAGSRFTGNSAANFGGAIVATTYLSLISSVLSGNQAGERSGAVDASAGRLDLIGTRVAGNSAATAPSGAIAWLPRPQPWQHRQWQPPPATACPHPADISPGACLLANRPGREVSEPA